MGWLRFARAAKVGSNLLGLARDGSGWLGLAQDGLCWLSFSRVVSVGFGWFGYSRLDPDCLGIARVGTAYYTVYCWAAFLVQHRWTFVLTSPRDLRASWRYIYI